MEPPTTFLAARRLHRCFTLPASSHNTSLLVTYSDIGHGSQSSPTTESTNTTRVALFIGGLMGGRYSLLRLHNLCTHHRVRLITIDKPGLGGSTPCSLQQRMSIWLTTVQTLLTNLSIPHVALMSHSGGALYQINTILALRHILSPTRPYVAFLAPWVHPKQSGNTTMKLTAAMPRSVVGGFDVFARFVHTYATPLVGFGSGVLGPGQGKGKVKKAEELDERVEKKADSEHADVDLGFDDEWYDAVGLLMGKYIFLEDVSGAGQEAVLYMRKKSEGGEVVKWGGDEEWDEYEDAVRLVVERERKWRQQQEERVQPEEEAVKQESTQQARPRKLHIDVWHAAKDNMIGKKGSAYFDGCWMNEKNIDEVIEFETRFCKGTDHETILDPRKEGAVTAWVEKMAKVFDEGESA